MRLLKWAILAAAVLAVAPAAAQTVTDAATLHPPTTYYSPQLPQQYVFQAAQAAPTSLLDAVLGPIVVPLLLSMLTAAMTWVTVTANKYLNAKGSAARADMINTWAKRAVQAAANYVEGAAPGLPVSYRIGAEWVERALEQCIALFPGTVAATGGEQAMRRRLWAEIQLHPGESVPGVAPVTLTPQPIATTATPIT